MAGTLSLLVVFCLQALAESLPESLFEDQQWRLCKSECIRLLKQQPANYNVQLLLLKSEAKLGSRTTNKLVAFLENPAIDEELKSEAAFLLADIYLLNNKPSMALDSLKHCFNHTKSGRLFASATQEANRIMNRNPELEKSHPELIEIIRTASKTWPRTTKQKTAASNSFLAKPALWVIALYRSQISPALGARCSLHPSCSAYAVESLKKHGGTGIALAGDRMIREPDVVELKATPVAIGNVIKYADPVTDHDFWHEKDN